MDIHLYNTLSRSKETFKPLKKGKVGMYHCGPTVYFDAHIGNLRAYVFADILRRTFEYNDYQVEQVINITDVGHLVSDGDDGEDKMTKALKREGKPLTLEAMDEVAAVYAERYIDDLAALNIEMPQAFPRASEHIQEDIEIVRVLEEKGFAYKTSDGMYFDTAKFPEYGKLAHAPAAKAQESESRIGSNPEKHSPADFALWKFDAKLGWESPWGRGFPGWHIECSAMSAKYLGQPFDIHTGGIDHIPVHHTNEIAQSEAAFDKPLSTYWMHSAFVTVSDGKMSKSAGGFLTLRSLIDEGISPIGYRYWLLTAHYRSPVDFSVEAVRSAQNALIRLMKDVSVLPEGGTIIASYQEKFHNSINDDFNMPQAVAVAWELIKDSAVTGADKKATLIDFDRVFGLKLATVPVVAEEPAPVEIQALAEAREEARKAKDWAKADALRKEIEDRGFELNDTPEGVKIREKS